MSKWNVKIHMKLCDQFLSSVVINTIVGLSFININALLVFIVFEPIIILGHL